MKTYELITLPPMPERTEFKVVAVVCDLCSENIKQLQSNGVEILNPKMVERFGDAVQVVVKLVAGNRNLDGGVGETTSFDICPGCFAERLQPWLEEQGAEAEVKPWLDRA